MADTESIKKQIDTSGNETLETQEMKDFLKSEENIKKLGEAMESGLSSELLEEIELSLKDLCEELIIHEDYSENQENIMNYFINKFGNKYPELKEKIELDNTTNTCIKENQIKVENIESINKRCNILGEHKTNTKVKVASIIQNKINDIFKSVNKKIGKNKTGFGFLYEESQIKYIQLWANVNFGENLIINGKRGGKMNDISSFTNEGITNLYIYRQELITRQGLIDYRKAKSNLKNFENLLNIPNLDAKLRLLTPDQQNSVMERFLTSFLAIKQSGMSFENKIGNEKLQTILTDLISAKIYEDLSVEDYFKIFYEEELMDEDTKLLKTDLMSSYKTIGEYFQAKATQNMEIVENEKENLVYSDRMAKYNQFIAIFNEINAENDQTEKENLKNRLKELGNQLLSKSRLSNNQRRDILIMLGGTFSEIQTKWDKKTIVEDKLNQGILYRGRPGNNVPTSIEYTPGCNVRVAVDKIATRTINDESGKEFTYTDPREVKIFLDDKELSPKNIKREGYDIYINKNNSLIIKKLGGEGSELTESFGDKVYQEYQIAKDEINNIAKENEELLDILAQVQSDNQLNISEITEQEKEIINKETGYTAAHQKYQKDLQRYKNANHSSGGSSLYRADSGTYTPPNYDEYLQRYRADGGTYIPIHPTLPNYDEYHQLNIPGCEGKLIHINPSEFHKIGTAISKYGNSLCFNPKDKSNGKIYELKLSDLNIIEEDKEGNIHLYEINDDLTKGSETKGFSARDIHEVERANNIIVTTVNMAPGLEAALGKAKNLNNDIDYIEKTYSKFDNHELNDNDAENIIKKAGSVINYLNELCNHHNDLVNLKKGLEERYSGESNIDTESEIIIKGTISNLDFLINATTPGGEIQKFCTSFLNEKNVHSNDEWIKRTIWRFRNNGIKTILAIASGVAAVCLVPVSGGGSLALFKMAAIMTAGGMAGGFIGQMGNERLNRQFTKSITLHNGEIIDVKYDDPTSLELALKGAISPIDFALQTSLQFIIGTTTTFGCMYAGQLVGGWITNACESGNISPKFAEFLNKFNGNFKETLKGGSGDPVTDGIFNEIANQIGQNPTSLIKNFNAQFFKEFGQEIREELSETGFQEAANAVRGQKGNTGLAIILSGLATLATAWHCLTPGGNMRQLYKENGISLGNLDYSGENRFEITLDYNGNRNAIIEYYTKNGYKLVDGHLEMPNKTNSSIKNIIYLKETSIPVQVRTLASELSGYGISINRETGKGYYMEMSKIQELELSGKVNVIINPKTKKVTIISGETTLEVEQDYFGGKSHKFDVSEPQARTNSKMMDNLGNTSTETQITEETKTKKQLLQQQYKQITGRDIELTNQQVTTIQSLKEQIQNQYKKATGKEIELSDIQILSIIEAHKMSGVIGNLDPTEISAKNHVLAKTIGDSDVRRFLFESGFCAKSDPDLRDPLNIIQRRQIENRIIGKEDRSKTLEQIREEIQKAQKELEQSKLEGDPEKIKQAEEKLRSLKENPKITKSKNAMLEAIEQIKKEVSITEGELEQARKEGNKEKIKEAEKKLQSSKNKEIVMNAILEKIESARFGLEQLLEGKPIGQLKDGTVVYAETIEQFLELYQLGLNEGKTTTVDENGEKTDLKRKKIDETSKMLAIKYYYEAVMQPLGLTIFADPSFTMENVNDNFVDETHSDGFEINEADKLTTEKCKTAEEIGSHILDQIAINEGRINKGEKNEDIKSMVNEEIEKLKHEGKETTESKIATELWASIQKHSEGKISTEDQAYLFAFSMKEMADYRMAYPNMTAEQTFTLLNSNQNKLIHQHLRDLNTVTSSDHGIKHVIRGNITLAENMFSQLENEGYWKNLYDNPKNKKEGETDQQFKARWKVLTRQAVIDHDLGYTHIANKSFDEEGFSKGFHMVSDHPLRSTTWIDNNQTFYTILFGEEGYNSLIESIPGHGNAQTQNISKIADGTATQTDFIRGILSCVDCAGSPGDYKIAHMFAQKEMIGGLFNAYSLLDAKNIKGTKQALKSLVETIDAMPDSGELALIKESRKKGIDAFLTNKHFNDMSPEELKNAFGFHFNKFLGAFGVRTEIDPNTGKVKAGINKKGGRSIEFALAGESFNILAERFGAGVALKSLIGVCDDYKINDKGPTSKFLTSQVDQAIRNRKYDKMHGKEGNLKDYIKSRLDPNHEGLTVFDLDKEGNPTPRKDGSGNDIKMNYDSEMKEFMDNFNEKGRKDLKQNRKEVTIDNGKFVQDGKVESRIQYNGDGGIIIHGPNNVEITLNFDGKSYDGFSETAGRFLEVNQKIDEHRKALEDASQKLKEAQESENKIEEAKDDLEMCINNIVNDLKKFGMKYSKQQEGAQRISTEQWSSITDGLTEMAATDPSNINIEEFINQIETLRYNYKVTMQQIQSSNPTLNQ